MKDINDYKTPIELPDDSEFQAIDAKDVLNLTVSDAHVLIQPGIPLIMAGMGIRAFWGEFNPEQQVGNVTFLHFVDPNKVDQETFSISVHREQNEQRGDLIFIQRVTKDMLPTDDVKH